MTVIDSGACRTSGGAGQAAATQVSKGSRGSFQDRADALVRATVLSDLGQSAGHGRHSHGIQGVAAAVRKVLSAQDVTGTDAADDVLKKIETSLHKAAQALADRGVDAKTIDATIDKFRAQLANALDGGGARAGTSAGASSGATGAGSAGTVAASGPAGASGVGAAGAGGPAGAGSVGAGGSWGSSGVVSGSAGSGPSSSTPASTTSSTTSVSTFVSREVRKERGVIDLVTAEGDHVSIRFRSKDVVTSSAAQATSADGTTVSAAKMSAFSRGGVKIDVDGDLNDNELAAIGDLLGKIDDVATQFFSGDVQAAFSAANSLGVDSDQIAGYRLNLTYSRKITAYGAVAMTLPAATQAPAGASDASATAAASAGSTATTAAIASGAGTPAAATTADAASADTSTAATTAGASGAPSVATQTGTTDGAATNGAPASGTAGTPPASTPSAQKTLIDFISDTLSKLGSANGAGRVSFSMHWKVSALVTALESVQPAQPTTPADQAAASNTQLFGDSLQKIAAA